MNWTLRLGVCALCVALAADAKAIAADSPAYRAAGPLAEPTLFAPGVISTGEFESHPAFMPDGRTLYFVRSDPDFTRWTIWVSRFADGRWTRPATAPFSGKHRDADPFITADGKHFYFNSDRPIGDSAKEDMDIWVMDRTSDGSWGEPRNLGAPVNSAASEWFPTIASSGTLYFGSGREGGQGRTDLYRAKRDGDKFAEPENLGPAINTAAHEYEPCIAPDESWLVFMALGRPDSKGGGDLYFSRLKDGKWQPATNLGPKINGAGLEISPYLSPDGTYFFNSSARPAAGVTPDKRPDRAGNSLGDIYQLDVDVLLELGK